MPSNLNKYRDHLYEYRKHPEIPADFVDRRDSYVRVYVSAIPFLAVEYFVELYFHKIPTGLVFPFGFLLFWCFYYTYYKPGLLENRLSDQSEFEIGQLPGLLIGVFIWFIKSIFLGLFKIFQKAFGGTQAPVKRARIRQNPKQRHRAYEQARAYQRAKEAELSQKRKEKGIHRLPPEVRKALHLMGLEDCQSWETIHKRYRELAKKYHPDLNPDLTDVGRRFIEYDKAYRKLSQYKGKYFK